MALIYLAARYSRREELNGYALDLQSLGHTITSRWLQGNHRIDDAGLSVEAKREERERFAQEDFEDVKLADWLIAFTEPPRSSNSRGGRHVELGIAIGLGRHILIIGPVENVFCALPSMRRFETWEACFNRLAFAAAKLRGLDLNQVLESHRKAVSQMEAH